MMKKSKLNGFPRFSSGRRSLRRMNPQNKQKMQEKTESASKKLLPREIPDWFFVTECWLSGIQIVRKSGVYTKLTMLGRNGQSRPHLVKRVMKGRLVIFLLWQKMIFHPNEIPVKNIKEKYKYNTRSFVGMDLRCPSRTAALHQLF